MHIQERAFSKWAQVHRTLHQARTRHCLPLSPGNSIDSGTTLHRPNHCTCGKDNEIKPQVHLRHYEN